ncbi:hypothetical protein [Poriferisphaera sp. WC338]|uniref:hypothetical protein n=1 Tax=Poriferisphaera sp. WC338 TaxID=3425129 RepID=UPI003D81BFB9
MKKRIVFITCITLSITLFVVGYNADKSGPGIDALVFALGLILGSIIFFVLAFISLIPNHKNLPKHGLAWQCAKCSHTLWGLSEPRCPECGSPLSAKQIQNAPPGMFNDQEQANTIAQD